MNEERWLVFKVWPDDGRPEPYDSFADFMRLM